MSIKDKPSLCMVVADIDFFFSHRAALAKKLSEKFQIIVISDIKESDESELLRYDFIKFVHLKSRIRENCSPKHVPAIIIKVPEIPRTKSGKIVELAVKQIINGEKINNKEAIANPGSLKFFENIPQLKL